MSGISTFCFYRKVPKVKGPLPIWPRYENKYTNPACAIMCMPCTPPILCIATIKGTIFHSVVLPVNPNDERMKVCFLGIAVLVFLE